jgi:hypothetical protein
MKAKMNRRPQSDSSPSAEDNSLTGVERIDVELARVIVSALAPSGAVALTPAGTRLSVDALFSGFPGLCTVDAIAMRFADRNITTVEDLRDVASRSGVEAIINILDPKPRDSLGAWRFARRLVNLVLTRVPDPPPRDEPKRSVELRQRVEKMSEFTPHDYWPFP